MVVSFCSSCFSKSSTLPRSISRSDLRLSISRSRLTSLSPEHGDKLGRLSGSQALGIVGDVSPLASTESEVGILVTEAPLTVLADQGEDLEVLEGIGTALALGRSGGGRQVGNQTPGPSF